MKHFTALAIMMAMVIGLTPARAAGEETRLEAVQIRCLELGLKVKWFSAETLIRRYGTDRMLLVYDGKSTLCTLENNWVTLDEFDAFGYFNADGLAPACLNGKWGVVDMDGKSVVDFLYDTQAQAEAAGNLAPVIPEAVDEDAIHEGLRRVQSEESGLWGFVNGAGEQMVPCLFDAVGYFDRGYASILADGAFGILENPMDSESIAAFQEATGGKFDVTWVPCAEGYSVFGLSTDQLIGESKVMGRYGFRPTDPVYCDYGLLDLAGRRLVPTIYGTTNRDGGPIGQKRFGFDTGKRANNGNDVIYADLLGNEFTVRDVDRKFEFDKVFDYGLEHPYWYGNYWSKERLIPGYFDRVGYFTDGVGVVSLDGVDFVIDKTGETLFTIDPEKYSDHDDEFHEGFLKVKDTNTGKWGAVDKTGKLVIPCQWAAMSRFGEGLACVRETNSGKEGYINAAGELVMPCILKGNNASNSYYEPDILITVNYLGWQGIWRNPTRKDKVSDWAAAEVTAAARAGYVTESCRHYQTYTITREQFASLAVNYLEKKTGQAIVPAPQDTFTDTADEAVRKAYAAGIVQGMGDGVFGPGRPLSREQLAAMLWRAMNKAGVTAVPADLGSYADSDKVSDWARESVAALAGLKVMEGTGGGMLSPKSSCTVEQAILLVYRGAK